MTGYSGTPLAARLGLKPGMTMRAVHAPKDYGKLLAPLPDGARIAGNGRVRADVVHHFARQAEEILWCRDGRHRGRDPHARTAARLRGAP